jgi:hypothetical protein
VPRELEDDIVVVHHLIRRLGRRPTAVEVMEFRQKASSAGKPPAAIPVPKPRLPGAGHR